jgi:hypothetical protein
VNGAIGDTPRRTDIDGTQNAPLTRTRRNSPVRDRNSLVSIVVAILGMTTACIAADADPSGDALERSFYPYATEKPVISALAPGTVLSKDNWQGGTDALPAELLQKVRSGALEVRIQETTDLPVSGPYVEATRKYASQTRLREDGSLDSYVAGRPFPVIDPSDPQAGTKMAWNDRYRDFGKGRRSLGHVSPARTIRPRDARNRILLRRRLWDAPG